MSSVKFTRPLNIARKKGKPMRRIMKKTRKRSKVNENTRQIRRIKNLIEKKHIDKVISDTFGNDAGVNNLHLIAQGDTSSLRTGLKISAKNLYINISLQWKTTATQETTARFIVFIDKLSNGAIPAGVDLMETLSTTSLYDNRNEGRRFIVLCDKLFNNTRISTSVSKLQGHNMIIPINRNIWYLDSTANATAVGRNSLYYLCIGDVASADADAVSISGNARLYFEDA